MTNEYYQKNKGKLRKEARQRYQTFNEKAKGKRRKKAQERY